MHYWNTIVLAAALASLVACGGETNSPAGSLSMSLTGETDGVLYRLRNATFEVTGPTTTTLHSETDPTAPFIAAVLPSGSYSVLLHEGWVLERVQPDGAVAVEATLISDNPVAVQVFSGTTSHAVFRFFTEGVEVEIGDGQLHISIDVQTSGTDTDPVSECDPLEPLAGCPDGEVCYLATVEGDGICAPEGELELGAECSSFGECVAGLVCLGQESGEFACTEVCQPSAPECTVGSCVSLSSSEDVGVCQVASETEAECSFLDPETCPAGEACYFDGTEALCLPAGTLPVGEECDAPNDCEAGAVCGDTGDGAQCHATCDPAAPDCPSGTSCSETGIGDLAVCL